MGRTRDKVRNTGVSWAAVTEGYRYKPEVLRALETHGIRPHRTTRPELVREFVNDLYRYEIRCLRDRLLRGDFPKHTYFDRVVLLRNKYSVLALRPAEFVE
jgi:hypothetical protein